jgi:uncharacterized damage-inducible protein DinB
MMNDQPSTASTLKIFKHAAWANEQIFDVFQKGNGPEEKQLRLFGHVLAAEQVWLARINGEDALVFSIWPEYTLAQCEQVMKQNIVGYRTLFEKLKEADFAKIITYPNSKGIVFHTSIFDILTQVSLHGSYHRGQIATLLRQAGEEPVMTDYIVYVRQLD